MKEKVVNLFWTSGWDSTYRLMELMTEGKTIQPYYILFETRKSAQMELKTMEEIRNYLKSKDNLKGKLLPLKIIDPKDIKANPEMQESYDNILKKYYLGNQYPHFANFAKNSGIKGLELSITVGGRVHNLVKNDVITIEEDGDINYRMSDTAEGDVATLFKWFYFPLFKLSKVDMGNNAKEKGFEDVMEKTWFCHTPTKDGKPCGTCNPCIYTYDDGLARRLPLSSRLKVRPAKIIKVVKKFLKPIRDKLIGKYN